MAGGELNLAIFEDKRHKADCISLQLAFMSDLTALSLRLKDPKIMIGKDKNNYLFKELRKVNEWIDTNVRSEVSRVSLPDTKSKFKGGIVFPMKIGDDKDPFVILGNIPELSAVFETKARAPFKIVFEVCRLSELVEETLAEEKAAAIEEGPADLGQEEESKAPEDSPNKEEAEVEQPAVEDAGAAQFMIDTMRTEDDHMG